jgi:hypothetical protein
VPLILLLLAVGLFAHFAWLLAGLAAAVIIGPAGSHVDLHLHSIHFERLASCRPDPPHMPPWCEHAPFDAWRGCSFHRSSARGSRGGPGTPCNWLGMQVPTGTPGSLN